MGDKTDEITSNLSALIVGVVMLCSAVIPIAVSQINSLTALDTTGNVVDIDNMQTLMGVAILMAILGLVFIVIRQMKNKQER